jgi:hypothetical protein
MLPTFSLLALITHNYILGAGVIPRQLSTAGAYGGPWQARLTSGKR